MDAIIADFIRVAHRLHTCTPKFKAKGNLSNMEFLILVGVSRMLEERKQQLGEQAEQGDSRKEGITLRELAEPFGMSMSAVSKKISILEKKGLLQRENSKTDRRNVYIRLTEEGETLCEREKEKKDVWMAEVIRRMGEENARKLIALLNQMFDVVEQMEQEDRTNTEE